MKKVFSILLVISMILSLCACGSKNETTSKSSKKELLAQADEVTISDLSSEFNNNEARAKALYNDKLVKIDDFRVDTISSYADYAKVTMWYNAGSVLVLDAKLSKEDVMSLNKGDIITVVGIFSFSMSGFANLNDVFIAIE